MSYIKQYTVKNVQKQIEMSGKKGELIWQRDVRHYSGHNTKEFGAAPLEKVIRTTQSSKLVPNLYEQIQPLDGHQFHCDLDCKYEEVTEKLSKTVTFDMCFQAMRSHIIPSVLKAADKLGIPVGHLPLNLFNSSVEHKFSFHAHFPGLYFANRNVAAAFAHHLHKVILDGDNSDLCMSIFDKSIYHNGQRAFRCPYSCKLGKTNVKKLWLDGRAVELNQLSTSELAGLFVRTNVANMDPIETFPGFEADRVYGQPGSGTKRVARADGGTAKRQKAEQACDYSEMQQIALTYLTQHLPDCAKTVRCRNSYAMSDGAISVHFVARDDQQGLVCPFGETHKANHFTVFVDPLLNRPNSVYCFANHDPDQKPRRSSVCTGCDACHASAIDHHNNEVQAVCADMPFAATRFNMDDKYYAFGGKPTDKQYHGRELLDDIAGRCITATGKNNSAVTIELSSGMGTGKTTGLMYVLRRIRQVQPECRIVMMTSRRALAAQLWTDSKATPFIPASTGTQQELHHVHGSTIDHSPVPRNSDLPQLDCIHYKHVAGELSSYRAVIVQIESTRRLGPCPEHMPTYDVVVIDEVTAHLKQLLAETMTESERKLVMNYFIQVMQSAKVVFFMCADMQDFVQNFCRETLRPTGTPTYHARVESTGFNSHVVSLREAKDRIVNLLVRKLPIKNNAWVGCNSRTEALDLQQKIESMGKLCDDLQLMNGVLLVSGQAIDISDKAKDNVFMNKTISTHVPKMKWVKTSEHGYTLTHNAEKTVFPVRAFIHTPAITHGFSVSDNTHFTHFFGVFTHASGVPARECVQMLARVRGVKDVVVGVSDGPPRGEKSEEDDTTEAQTLLKKNNSDEHLITSYIDVTDSGPQSQLAKFFKEEELRSRRGMTREIVGWLINHPQNKVFLKADDNGFENAEDQKKKEFRKWQMIRVRSQAITQITVEGATEDSLERVGTLHYFKDLAEKLYGCTLSRSPKRMAAFLITLPVYEKMKTMLVNHSNELKILLTRMGYDIGDDTDITTVFAQLQERPSPTSVGSVREYRLVATNLVYKNNPVQRKKAHDMRKVDINTWVALWNRFMKDSFKPLLVPCKQEKIKLMGKRVGFRYHVDRVLWDLASLGMNAFVKHRGTDRFISARLPTEADTQDYSFKAMESLYKEIVTIDAKDGKGPGEVKSRAFLFGFGRSENSVDQLVDDLDGHFETMSVCDYHDLQRESNIWVHNYVTNYDVEKELEILQAW